MRLANNCLGRLWPNESQVFDGNRTNSFRRSKPFIRSIGLVQVIQSVCNDLAPLKIIASFNVVQLNPKFRIMKMKTLHYFQSKSVNRISFIQFNNYIINWKINSLDD